MQRIARGGGASRFKHVLDEIDAAARAIELVSQQCVGRARCGTEAAMHTGAQDLFVFLHSRFGELRVGERGLHQMPAYMRPGFRIPSGSKLSFTRLVNAARAAGCGWKTLMVERASSLAEISVA